MNPVVRFAPSPTGKLHVGNIRLALINWLFAKKYNGIFILRMDDTDTERSSLAFEQGIIQDLQWLGLDHDKFYRQLERLDLYDQAIETLKKKGRLYSCYETREELDMKRKLQLSRNLPPKYDRSALNLSEQEKRAYEQQGRTPHWRLKLTDDTVTWEDMIHGRISFEGSQLSDPILIREDGRPIYTLSSVVDDLDMGVTHIIRGDDHIANTAVQIQLIEALGHDKNTFTYAHTPWIIAADGSGLSKRYGSLSIESLRNQGILPIAIHSLLATLGTSDSIHLAQDIEQLIEEFDIKKINKSASKFSIEDLKNLNKQAIQRMSLDQAMPYLKDRIPRPVTQDFWHIIRDNSESFDDVKDWWESIYQDIPPFTEEKEYLEIALECLPSQPWTEETWDQWTSALREKTGRKGKTLFMPLRQALTGKTYGPEMKKVLPLIGYEKTRKRLEQTCP